MKKKLLLVAIALAIVSHNSDVLTPPASSGVWDACSSSATIPGPALFLVCPQGDGPTLFEIGAAIAVTVKDITGAVIVGIPPSDFWLIGCADQLVLCAGSGSINADHATDTNGKTTISGALAAGGYDTGMKVVAQGVILPDPTDCWSMDLCLPLTTVSPDVNADLLVDIIDFSIFGPAFPTPPNTYDPALDFNGDGSIDIIDFSIFGQHFLHAC